MMPKPGVIQAELGNNQYVVRCGFCQGEGKYRDSILNTTTACKICDGKGVLKVHSDDVLLVDAVCQGSGRLTPHSFSACDLCQGLGVRALTGNVRVITGADTLKRPTVPTPITVESLVLRIVQREDYSRKIFEEWLIIKCAFCNGTGLKQIMEPDETGNYLRFSGQDEGSNCFHCDGKGVLEAMGSERTLCLRCKGTGHEPTKNEKEAYKSCDACSGTGLRYAGGQYSLTAMSVGYLHSMLREKYFGDQ